MSLCLVVLCLVSSRHSSCLWVAKPVHGCIGLTGNQGARLPLRALCAIICGIYFFFEVEMRSLQRSPEGGVPNCGERGAVHD